jgi:hypothetical protein
MSPRAIARRWTLRLTALTGGVGLAGGLLLFFSLVAAAVGAPPEGHCGGG